MQHSIKDDYINSIKNYTNQFEDTNFRRIACNDFKSWPSPREETWRLSRLGSLSRKKIKPIHPNLKNNLATSPRFPFLSAIIFIFCRQKGQ